MRQIPAPQTIPVAQLLLDLGNPRLPQVQQNQQDAIISMVDAQGDKILALAEHLVDHGPNPASIPIVAPSEGNAGSYVVLDGNRRVTALKLLESPDLAQGVLSAALMQRLNRLSARFQQDPIAQLACTVVDSREDADVWIPLIHRGYQQGAGLVEWDTQVGGRYDARRTGEKRSGLQVVDFVKQHSTLSPQTQQLIERGRFPLTSLERLINTPAVRDVLGVAMDGKQVTARYPIGEVIKGLAKIVEDLGTKAITVSDIKRQEQRVDYANRFAKHERPDPSTVLNQPYPLMMQSPWGGSSPQGTGGKLPRRATARSRDALIPTNCKLQIASSRIDSIYKELRTLRVDRYANAVAVMLRVFIELSLDDILEHKLNWPEKQVDGSHLATKLLAVADHFEKNQIMTPAQLAVVRKAAAGQTLLLAAIKTLHGYVHNRHFSPIPSELKTTWDDLQPFIEKIWAA